MDPIDEIDWLRSTKSAIDKARLTYASQERHAQDKSAQLENRRLNLMNQLKAMQESTDLQLQKMGARLKQQLVNADSDFQQNLMLLQQKQAAAQMQAQQAQASNLRRLESTDRDLQQASRDQAVASNRLLCADRNGGNKTQAQADASSTSAANVRAAKLKLGSALGLCAALPSVCINSVITEDQRSTSSVQGSTCYRIEEMSKGMNQKTKAARSATEKKTVK